MRAILDDMFWLEVLYANKASLSMRIQTMGVVHARVRAPGNNFPAYRTEKIHCIPGHSGYSLTKKTTYLFLCRYDIYSQIYIGINHSNLTSHITQMNYFIFNYVILNDIIIAAYIIEW